MNKVFLSIITYNSNNKVYDMQVIIEVFDTHEKALEYQLKYDYEMNVENGYVDESYVNEEEYIKRGKLSKWDDIYFEIIEKEVN